MRRLMHMAFGRREARCLVLPWQHSVSIAGRAVAPLGSRPDPPLRSRLGRLPGLAHIPCTVSGCASEAVIVLNNHPICQTHCEELARRSEVLDITISDVLPPPRKELARPDIGAEQD